MEGLIEERGRGLDLSDGFFLILRDGIGIDFEDFVIIFLKWMRYLMGCEGVWIILEIWWNSKMSWLLGLKW